MNLAYIKSAFDRVRSGEVPFVLDAAIAIATYGLVNILIPTKIQGEDTMGAPKTTPILLKDGADGRGVKVTKTNYNAIKNWLGEKHVDLVFDKDKSKSVKGEEDIYDIPLFRLQAKGGLRRATVGDVIVKIGRGSDSYFRVVKADDFEKFIKI